MRLSLKKKILGTCKSGRIFKNSVWGYISVAGRCRGNNAWFGAEVYSVSEEADKCCIYKMYGGYAADIEK